MKPNEVMIVDCVEYGQYITTVRNLSDKIVLSGCVGRLDEVRPINITNAILEANGITLLEVGDNGPATPKKHLNRYEKWFIHTTWKDTFLWYDRMADHWHLQDMSGARFHHVHELQHALRLAGLADLADNFKIMKGGQQ